MTPRLLKVLVQPVFVAEVDGELVEIPVHPGTLTAAQWKQLDPQTWADQGAEALAEQIAPALDTEAE